MIPKPKISDAELNAIESVHAYAARQRPLEGRRLTGDWSYSGQFRHCNKIGLCIHMSKANHDAMPKKQQKEYAKHKKFMCMDADYFGPRGPLFCAESPGVCSSHHCPLRKR